MSSFEVNINKVLKCSKCEHTHVHPAMYPCNDCVQNVSIPKDHFEPREVKEGNSNENT